jgi:hypothetical protein
MASVSFCVKALVVWESVIINLTAMYLSLNGTDPLVVEMHGGSMEGDVDGAAEVFVIIPE